MFNRRIAIGFLVLVTVLPFCFYLYQQNIPNHKDLLAPNDWLYQQRSYPYTSVNHEAISKSVKQYQRISKENKRESSNRKWEFAGATNIGGRISDIEMQDNNLQMIYAGTATGGIFRSNNQGETWEPIFDDVQSLTIGDLQIAPSDTSIIYVGTGEPNAGGGSVTFDGNGIYKTTDAGKTWENIGLKNVGSVGRLTIHPTNPNIVYVAAMGYLFEKSVERGVYKTTDGGKSWEKVMFIADNTGAIDLVIDPINPTVVYAAFWQRERTPTSRKYGGNNCKIYKTIDSGENWTELTNGLPTSNKGRIGLSICRDVPNTLYAIYADESGDFKGIYKTENAGLNWTKVNDSGLSNSFASYGWWFGRIQVSPTNPDLVFLIGFNLYRSENGGDSWQYVSSGVHVDHHSAYIHPLNNNLVVNGNDGGVYISKNKGTDWQKSNTLPITQFYTSEVDYQFPNRLYGGTQDNGTNRTTTGSIDDWRRIGGGDGFVVRVDPVDNKYVYAESQYGALSRSTNGGRNFSRATSGISGRKNWNTPYVFDPQNSKTLFYGSNRIYKSTDRAVTWNMISPFLTNLTITSISVSPIESDIIWVGTEDGRIWYTKDGGENWQEIDENLPNRWVTRVIADPNNIQNVYITFSGYRWNEYIPHVNKLKAQSSGFTTEDLSSNLPEAPVNDLIINSIDPSVLYVGTDQGVFVSYNDGAAWEVLGSGLPTVSVLDLTFHEPTQTLVAATYGRSMYKIDVRDDVVASTNLDDDTRISEMTVYPNPVNSNSVVRLNLPTEERGSIVIHNQKGEVVKILYDGKLSQGEHFFELDGIEDFQQGMYTCRFGGKKSIITRFDYIK